MLLPIVFITLALLFYSISIWSERIKKKIVFWMVILMTLGFISDLVGTGMMVLKSRKLSLNSHMMSGYIALFIMGVHLVWAIMAVRNVGKTQVLFNRFSVYAWCIWMIAFISGMPM